jgi:phospholipid/cholesterol/gamma-HCH transport system permease protein
LPRNLLALPRAVGGAVVDSAAYAIRISAIIGYALHSLTVARGRLRPVVRAVLYRQILFTGVQAIPFTALIAGLVAMIVVVQARLGGGVAEGGVVGRLLVVAIVRELGPLVVGTIVVARSCSAIAAELGNMRVGRELDSLVAMGVDPFEYLVLPRLTGVAVAVMCLTVVFVTVSLGAGAGLTALLAERTGAGEIMRLVGENLQPVDHLVVLAKTLVPGLLMAAISCHEGLSASGSVTAVPPAVTAAVVRSLAAVFVWDSLVTALVYVA